MYLSTFSDKGNFCGVIGTIWRGNDGEKNIEDDMYNRCAGPYTLVMPMSNALEFVKCHENARTSDVEIFGPQRKN